MTERRYSEEEVAAIFDRAAKAQVVSRPQLSAGEGMTLAGLQEIGREVGIPPELVAQAARSLDLAGSETTRRLLGMPIGVGKTIGLDRRLSDAEWDRLVVDLRETFDATGWVKQDGAFRQWTNSNLKVLVEPAPTGQRVRFQTYNGTAAGLIGGGLAMLGVCAAMAIALAASGRLGEPRPLSGLAFMAILSLGAFAWGAIRLPSWAQLRRRQMDELAERLASSEERKD
jgi:hypothetical protein